MNIPFFVDSETGEVDHLFRANWSVIPSRLITRSGIIVNGFMSLSVSLVTLEFVAIVDRSFRLEVYAMEKKTVRE